MGLVLSHGKYRSSCSTFNDVRRYIAALIGIPLVEGPISGDGYPQIPDKYFKREHFQGEWEELPEDPIYVLLAHSDCDGIIHKEHLPPLIERLKGISLEDDKTGGYFPDLINKLIQSMEAAVAADEDMEFH